MALHANVGLHPSQCLPIADTRFSNHAYHLTMSILVRAACLTNFREVAIASGLNPVRLLLDAGLSPNVLDDPDLMIPVERVSPLLHASALASGNESFGLSMAKSRLLSNMGAVGLLMRDQVTLRESLATLVRHHGMLNGALTLGIDEFGSTVVIREVLMTGRTPQPARQRVELAMGVMMRAIRQLVGFEWQPRQACFEHAAPKDLSLHTQLFGPHVVFNADFNGIVCTQADLDMRNPFADPAMARYTQRLLDVAGSEQRDKLLVDVRHAMLLLLPTGRCSIEVVAERLGVAPRTIQRRFSDRDISFSVLLNALRKELAARYVLESSRPLTEVAELLGFNTPSSFSRWYQTQFATSAKQSRANK